MTQNQMILAALKRGRRLTPLQALKDFGCFRLGARVWELKKAGHKIRRDIVELVDGKHVAQYRLERA